jgi:DNA anti-recombination protein RmuC
MFTLANKYSYLAIFLAGFFIGFYICALFNGCGPRASLAVKGDTKIVEKLEQQVAVVQTASRLRIDSLGAVSQHLQTDLQNARIALNTAKKKNAALQTQIYALLDKAQAEPLDTLARLADCDSLGQKVKDLVAGDSTKDSLYEKATADLQEQVVNRDSVLQVQYRAYQSLKDAFDQSVTANRSLVDETKVLKRSIRRQKVRGTLGTIGLVIATALMVHYLDH